MKFGLCALSINPVKSQKGRPKSREVPTSAIGGGAERPDAGVPSPALSHKCWEIIQQLKKKKEGGVSGEELKSSHCNRSA